MAFAPEILGAQPRTPRVANESETTQSPRTIASVMWIPPVGSFLLFRRSSCIAALSPNVAFCCGRPRRKRTATPGAPQAGRQRPQPGHQRASLGNEPTDRRARCGKSARPVRREGGRNQIPAPLPLCVFGGSLPLPCQRIESIEQPVVAHLHDPEMSNERSIVERARLVT
jgi:hypothetical protein